MWFDQSGGDRFAYYSIGLLAGMILYYVQFLITNGKRQATEMLFAEIEEAGHMPFSLERTTDEQRDIEEHTG